MKRAMMVLILLAAAAATSGSARAQTLNSLGVARLNADAQALWAQDGLPVARRMATQELQKLVGVPHQVNSKTTATITRINSVTLDCPIAPGLTRLDQSRVEGRLPLTGEWRVAASADLYVKGKILLIPVDRTYTIDIEVKEIAASVRMDIDSSDPAAPKLAHIYPPTVDFKLKVTTSSWVLNFLSWLTRSTVNGIAGALTNFGADYLTRTLNLQYAGTPQVYGTGGPALAAVAPADLAGAAVKLEDEMFRYKMPDGTVFEGDFDRDYAGTWEQSLADPNFSPGNVDRRAMGFGGDSAHMTGHLLAGIAFRYAVTRSPVALAHARRILEADRLLLTMRGEPGNLNRSICPYDPSWMQPMVAPGTDKYVQRFDGVDYVMSDYISRDAYMGTFFGLSTAFEFIDDPQVRSEAGALIEMAIDYLLRNDWTWRKRDGSMGERWQGTLEQQYAWVLAAYRVNPAKYAAVLEAYKGFADILWVPIWTSVLDPYYSYYKFNLAEGAMYTLLRLEGDYVRFQRAYQGVAILRHFIGHHQNAHFNNVYLAFDQSSRQRLGRENENLLTRWLRQPRRRMIFDLSQDPTIEKTTYTVPFDTNLLFPGQGVPRTVVIARYPVPVEKRISAGFRWSRSPYAVHEDYAWGPQPRHEGESLDFTLPYWMARYYRAIPAPRVPATPATSAASAVR